VVALTQRGSDCLVRSARIFDELRSGWAQVLGETRLRALEDDLRRVAPGESLDVDAPGWLGAAGG
jgi:hypothetical protein